MNDAPSSQPAPGNPMVTPPNKWRVSLIWLVPAIAALIGISMLIHTWTSAGPKITITFNSAAGLEAGKTQLKYKEINIGVVNSITLSKDGSQVIAHADIDKTAAALIRQDSRFWVVRPRIGAGGVSGVDTLLSGAYIGVDKGHSAENGRKFTGLETPPTVIGDMPGTSYVLKTNELDSLDVGSPIYYRSIPVGHVASYQLSDDGRSVNMQIFVDAPYDKFVTLDTRFWNASGIDVSLGANGLKMQTQSLATIVSGGIAFSNSFISRAEPAPKDTKFTLAKDQQSALAPPDGPSQNLRLRFDQSLRGLSIGAPVQFIGIDLGNVRFIKPDYDAAKGHFSTVVGIEVYPERLGDVLSKLPQTEGNDEEQMAQFMARLVEQGLRAQARTGNLLTGQLYIALDFAPKAPKVAFDPKARPLSLPTVSGSFDQLQEQMASIVNKIDRIPLDSIGRNLDSSLANLNKTLAQVNGQTLPQTTQTLQDAQKAIGSAQQAFAGVQQTLGDVQSLIAADAPLQQDLGETLTEVRRTARSLRTLTDMLGRHPESVIRGRPTDVPEAPASTSKNTTNSAKDTQ
ncbi:MlaD family protein [Comamonas thiooxydans]|uniref:MlaD family protein n=1 Tax=Comamonas thiooxydans TaxID=363952 RepID=A0AA42Q3N4_9BURK|nr:MlaD family protein [Comamonas thiooxydans]MDH1336667.1 MlaD family protein [Comamonas thiooxydans]MDH1742715.1 MlaD family protein [Comamonas thiooxydans]MDH1789138.1 MlaD family protein [Comamonas thiooxydans]